MPSFVNFIFFVWVKRRFSEDFVKFETIVFEIIMYIRSAVCLQKWPIINNFFVFDPFLMKLGEIVALMSTTISPSFIENGSKTKKFL